MGADELERLRRRRNTGWSIIRRRHLEGVAISEDEIAAFSPSGELAGEFEAAIRVARSEFEAIRSFHDIGIPAPNPVALEEDGAVIADLMRRFLHESVR